MSRAELVFFSALFAVVSAPLTGCARETTAADDGGAPQDGGSTSDSSSMSDAGEVDAGVDAGTTPDLGMEEDAGTGVDLGFHIDLGPRDDASTGDAGAMDAGAVDAGHPDGGSDAGHPDGGTDAGHPDAGTDAGPAPDAAIDAGACPFGWDDTVDATIDVTVDDSFTLYVAGASVASGAYWPSVQTVVVPLHRHPGRANVLALDAYNAGSVDGRDRGAILDLTATVDGTDRVLVSDTSWRFGAGDPGWSDEAFDDSAWTAAVDQGANGIGPWGPVLGTSTASWLWSFDSNLPVSGKPGAEHVYLRRTFYFDASGAISDTPSACP